MKKIFALVLFCLLITSPAYSYFYVVDTDNNVVARMDYEPNQDELDIRDEIIVISNEDIPLSDAEYRGGNIVLHEETQQEKDKKEKKDKGNADMLLIQNRILLDACELLESEGVNFDEIKCSDFE